MLKRFVRSLLEPFVQALRRFFDPRIAQLDLGLRQEIRKQVAVLEARIESLAAAIAEESATAAVRDESMRDGLTFTNVRIGRIEDEMVAVRRALDAIKADSGEVANPEES